VPTIAIDGRYVTSPAQAASSGVRVAEDAPNAPVLQVMDFLVAKAQKEKGIAPISVSKTK